MKLTPHTFGRSAVLVLLLCLGALTASAQSTEALMTVHVPFAFQVGEQKLPAGQYTIKRDPQMPQFLYVQSPNRKVSARTFATVQSLTQQPLRASLIFTALGEKHFLAEVRDLQHGLVFSLLRSKEERRLAKAQPIRALPTDHRINN